MNVSRLVQLQHLLSQGAIDRHQEDDGLPSIEAALQNAEHLKVARIIGACELKSGGLLGEEIPGSWIFC